MTTSRWLFALLIAGALIANNASAHFTLTANPGYSIFWLGGDGDNFAAAVPANLATTGTSFGSTAYPAAAHSIAHINDGSYGNSNSWLADPGDLAPQIGVALGGTYSVNSFAFGRDNGGEATQYTARNLGTYTLQRTLVAAPSAARPSPALPPLVGKRSAPSNTTARMTRSSAVRLRPGFATTLV